MRGIEFSDKIIQMSWVATILFLVFFLWTILLLMLIGVVQNRQDHLTKSVASLKTALDIVIDSSIEMDTKLKAQQAELKETDEVLTEIQSALPIFRSVYKKVQDFDRTY